VFSSRPERGIRTANDVLGSLSGSLTPGEIERAQRLARYIGAGNQYITGAGLDFDGWHWRRQTFGERAALKGARLDGARTSVSFPSKDYAQRPIGGLRKNISTSVEEK